MLPYADVLFSICNRCGMTHSTRGNEYLAIRAWGEMMKSARTYIMSEQERAAEATLPSIQSISAAGNGSRAMKSQTRTPDADLKSG